MANLDDLPVEVKVAFRRQSVRVMRDLLALAAVVAGAEDYQRARDTFFTPGRKIWFMFGGTIKRLSPDLGAAIESLLNSINTLLDQASPPKDSLVKSFEDLNRSLDTAVQISDERL